MLILFTKLKENRPFYKRDLLNACSLPAGDRILFSYRAEWLSRGVSAAPDGDLVGKQVLVSFAEEKPTTSDERLPPLYYHPIRFGVVLGQSKVEGSITFEVELTKFFDYGKHSSAIDDTMAKFQLYVTKSKDTPANGCFVREDDDSYLPDQCVKYLPLLQHVRKLNGLDKSIFCVLREDACSSEFSAPKRANRNGQDECSLIGGSEYRIGILAIFGSQAQQIVPTLALSSGLGSMSGPFVRQRSSGVEVDYWISLRRLFQKDMGILSLRAVDPNDSTAVVSSDLTWLLRVGVTTWHVWAAIAFIVLGAAIGSVAPDQLTTLGVSRSAIEWSLAGKVLGSILLGFGVWLGFSRLPLKAPS